MNKKSNKQMLFEMMHKVSGMPLNEAHIDKDGNLQDFNPNLNDDNLVDFDSFPPEIKKTLDDEYGDFDNNFDWNEKSKEFGDDNSKYNPVAFNNWRKKNKSEQFLLKIDDIIRKTTQDMILIKKRDIAGKKLQAFEELIIPALSDEVLTKRLTKYEEDVILNPNASIERIEQGFKNAKHQVGDDIETSLAKSEMSDIFLGGDINVPAFERYISKHPEKRKTYDAWKKLNDEDYKLNYETNLHAFRDTTSIDRIRELRDFLINYKKTKM